jgi:hypothetical protein
MDQVIERYLRPRNEEHHPVRTGEESAH